MAYVSFYMTTFPDHHSSRYSALPALSLRQFCNAFFQHCPLLQNHLHRFDELFARFQKYLFQVPVCGTILLNRKADKVLLVKGYGSRCWSFPKGKVNQGEQLFRCAIREAQEEVGFDCSHILNQQDYISITRHGKLQRMYIIPNIPLTYNFLTHTTKEIERIQWFSISTLLEQKKKTSFYPVNFFLEHLIRRLERGPPRSPKPASKYQINAPQPQSKRSALPLRGQGRNRSRSSSESDVATFGSRQRGWSAEEVRRQFFVFI
jgi:mRNA-decapping enzyme subunit 2